MRTATIVAMCAIVFNMGVIAVMRMVHYGDSVGAYQYIWPITITSSVYVLYHILFPWYRKGNLLQISPYVGRLMVVNAVVSSMYVFMLTYPTKLQYLGLQDAMSLFLCFVVWYIGANARPRARTYA